MKTYSHRLYEMDWIVDGRVSYCKYWGEYTAEDLLEWDRTVVDMLDQLPDEVTFCHAIYDMSEIRRMAPLRDHLGLEVRKHPKVGWTIIVGSLPPLTRFVVAAVTQVMRARTRFVKSLEEAIDLLRSVDPALTTLDIETARAVVEAVDARAKARRSGT